eukprot:TRINITY_DN1147_c0_g5_i1.p1 TRINITY_DN1147_c0_g5~~TRINITY_DN1147_c0_g5_i1.p1  ORF type:complete len:390 (+),score=99.26 TRINITY_DN1147_c0_g5_i1:190-1359(+)
MQICVLAFVLLAVACSNSAFPDADRLRDFEAWYRRRNPTFAGAQVGDGVAQLRPGVVAEFDLEAGIGIMRETLSQLVTIETVELSPVGDCLRQVRLNLDWGVGQEFDEIHYVILALFVAHERFVNPASDLAAWFGCPQQIAKRGYYGAYLMEDWPLIHSLVRNLHENLKVAVFCKIRIYPGDVDRTIQYAKMLESAGCQLLTVHGRTRDQRKCFNGDGVYVPADWDVIKRVRESVSIPVFGNGNIQFFEDAQRLMQYTGVDGVMSACTLLNNPALFSGTVHSPFELALEYIELAKRYETYISWVRAHLAKILETQLTAHLDLMDRLFDMKDEPTLDELPAIVEELRRVVESGETGRQKKTKDPDAEPTSTDATDSILDDGGLDMFAAEC